MTVQNSNDDEEAVDPVRPEHEIQAWITGKLCDHLQVAADELDVQQPIVSYGLDSMHAVVIIAELEEWLNFKFVENPLYDYPTIAALSNYLARQSAAGKQTQEPE